MFAGYSGHSAYSWGGNKCSNICHTQCNGIVEGTTSLFIKLQNYQIRTLAERKSVGYDTTVCTQGGEQGIRLQLEKR
jgi:hypothetical protein